MFDVFSPQKERLPSHAHPTTTNPPPNAHTQKRPYVNAHFQTFKRHSRRFLNINAIAFTPSALRSSGTSFCFDPNTLGPHPSIHPSIHPAIHLSILRTGAAGSNM